jgi:hypothetical protein
MLLWTFSCGVTEGPLLRARDADVPDAPTADAGVRVSQNMRLHYQVSGELEVAAAADVFVTDLFDTEVAQVASLHAAGRLALAYFSAGSFEPWRPDADQFPERTIGSPLANYPDERWLDIRSANVRAIMQARLELARDKGFDGVFPGSLNAYRSDTGFALNETDQLAFDRFLSTQARALGLTPGLSGDFALTTQLVAAFDWAIVMGCLAADSCEALRPLLDQHKAVFDLETTTTGDLSVLCSRAQALGITMQLKRPSFDAWNRSCP